MDTTATNSAHSGVSGCCTVYTFQRVGKVAFTSQSNVFSVLLLSALQTFGQRFFTDCFTKLTDGTFFCHFSRFFSGNLFGYRLRESFEKFSLRTSTPGYRT